MGDNRNRSLYEQAEQWLKTLYLAYITKSAVARRFGVSIFEVATLAKLLEAAKIPGYECPPSGQWENRICRHGKRSRKAVWNE